MGQSGSNEHDEIMFKLGTLIAGQRHLREDFADIKKMAVSNKRDILLAKGGAAFATLASTGLGLFAYFG